MDHFSGLRRVSSHNSLSGRSPIHSLDRSAERRSADRRSMENRSFDKRSTENRIPESRRMSGTIEKSFESRPPENPSSEPPSPVNDNISSNIVGIFVNFFNC